MSGYGETGSGKTTEIAPMVLQTLGEKTRVMVTVPRVLAAVSVSEFVAQKNGWALGREVGYEVRHDRKVGEDTKIRFATEGVLIQRIYSDPLLEQFDVVIVDEAHERGLFVDFELGLLRRIQMKRREKGLPELKVIVTSATLEKEKFGRFLGAKPIEVSGRQYEVEKHFAEQDCWDVKETMTEAALKVRKVVSENKDGDILIFMPGEEEVKETIKLIKELNLEVETLPLFGSMEKDEQRKVFARYNRRKVIVATNIAETSITVPGIKHIVDSGLVKEMRYDSETGISQLVITETSQASCRQRAGRAGRLSNGEYYALFTESNFKDRLEFSIPEIQRSNLANVVLMMKKLGIEDVLSFEFIDEPPLGALEAAVKELKQLGALDDEEHLTEDGRLMAELPLEPHEAKMMILADKFGCTEELATIVAFLGGQKPVFFNAKDREELQMAYRKFKVDSSDYLTLLKVWEEYKANGYSGDWAKKNHLNVKVLEAVGKARVQILDICKKNNMDVKETENRELVEKCILAGLADNLMVAGFRREYIRLSDNQDEILIHPSSAVYGGELIVAKEIVATKRTFARMVQRVEPEWIIELLPHLVEKDRDGSRIFYDANSGTVIRNEVFNLKIDRRRLGVRQTQVEGIEGVATFSLALVQGMVDLPVIRENRQVSERLEQIWNRSQGKASIRGFSAGTLAVIYGARLGKICSKSELDKAIEEGKVDLRLYLNDYISEEEVSQIEKDNPTEVVVGGERLNLNYRWLYERFFEVRSGEVSSELAVEILDEGLEVNGLDGQKIELYPAVGLDYSSYRTKYYLKFYPTLEEAQRNGLSKEQLKGRLEVFSPVVSVTPRIYSSSFSYRPSRQREVASLSGMRIRMDDYQELAAQSEEELGSSLERYRKADIGKWRLAAVALVAKGPSGIEILSKEKVKWTEEMKPILAALEKAESEINRSGRDNVSELRTDLNGAERGIKTFEILMRVSGENEVKELIGNDSESLATFRHLMYEEIERLFPRSVPSEKEAKSLVSQVLERMTV